MYWRLGSTREDADLIGLGCNLGTGIFQSSPQEIPMCSQGWNLLLKPTPPSGDSFEIKLTQV